MTQPPQTVLVAFLQTRNCSHLPVSWRHPAAAADLMGAEHHRRTGRMLEDGCIHPAFLGVGIPRAAAGAH